MIEIVVLPEVDTDSLQQPVPIRVTVLVGAAGDYVVTDEVEQFGDLSRSGREVLHGRSRANGVNTELVPGQSE